MKVLITGITGFVGSHLADYCLSLDEPIEVIGTCRWRSRRENIEHIEDAIELHECDLRDASSVTAGAGGAMALDASVADAEKTAIQSALKASGGNRTHAAKALGISRRTLHNKLREYEIE